MPFFCLLLFSFIFLILIQTLRLKSSIKVEPLIQTEVVLRDHGEKQPGDDLISLIFSYTWISLALS